MKKNIVFIVLCLLFAGSIFAESLVEVSASTDKKQVGLGDSVGYTISVKRIGNFVRPPPVKPPTFDGFRIAGTSSSSAELKSPSTIPY